MPHSASKHVTVERIATKPMSGHQREHAVTSLAALISAWQHDQDDPCADSASLLPLLGPSSNTDHAA
jgi:hypothetical protein